MSGQTGPESRLAATGTELQGYSGFTALTGYEDKAPYPPYGAYTDLIVPSLGAGMIAGAIAYRNKTGKGQMIDLSQNEASLAYLGPAFLNCSANGIVETRKGNKCDYNPPSGCKFHTRCKNCTERCVKEKPELKEVSSGHFCACHLMD